MRVLYLNNFRGFSNTFLQLKDVNFFVGENSTGKTSILKIVKTLTDNEFWLSKDLSLENSDLGFFDEIASKNSSNSSFFEVGFLEIFGSNDMSAVKLNYIDNNGVASLKEIHLLFKNLNLHIQIEKEILKYKYQKFDLFGEENIFKYFKEWVKGVTLNTSTFKSIRRELMYPIIIDISFLLKELGEEYVPSRILPGFIKDMSWSAPIRSKPKRTYDDFKSTFNPDGSHTPYSLKKFLQDSHDKSNKKIKKRIEDILNRFGSDSGLYEQISIKPLESNPTSPFQVQVKLGGKNMNITNVGYGVSQILPLIVDIIVRGDNTWFSIQQPEVHLHPKGQAAVGDFIFKSLIEENKNFIIETHSEYLMDRFRLRLNRVFKENSKEIKSTQIVFFQRTPKGNILFEIPINSDGTISDEQPETYREFFIHEQMDLLNI